MKELTASGVRLIILRIGFVIDRTGGALPVMARPVRWFAGAHYGSGKQFISWIDSKDLARLFLHSLTTTSMSGVYNAVAPAPVSNRMFVHAVGKKLHRPVWPLGIPAFVFHTVLGEQSELVLGSQRASASKILGSGFQFEYATLEAALSHHL